MHSAWNLRNLFSGGNKMYPYFEPHFKNNEAGLTLEGQFAFIKVINLAGKNVDLLDNIIDPAKHFEIELKWEIHGSVVASWISSSSKDWHIKVFAESVGEVCDVILIGNTLSKGNPQEQYYFMHTLIVPAGLLRERNPTSNDTGIYKLIISVFLDSAMGDGCDIFGFAEGPTVRVERSTNHFDVDNSKGICSDI